MRKIFEKFLGKNTTLIEKQFRIIIAAGIIAMVMAIISNIVMKQAMELLAALIVGLMVLLLSFWIYYRYNKTDFAAMIVVAVIDLIIFPIIYFTSGGIESGATVWFVLGIIFEFLLFDGKKLIIMLAVTFGVLGATYIYGYLHPDLIIPMASGRDVIFDSMLAVFMVGISIGVLIKFHSGVYEKERQKAEMQKEKLEEVNLSKSQFFANMSHEIRTPINTIIGLNEMTLRENISDEIAENAINIQNASKMLLSLINDILDLSKIESGNMEIIPVQYETGSIISELINIIWVKAHEKHLEFKLNVDKNIPSMLFGDEVRIRQILVNLLTNAVKYTKEGSITFAVSCKKCGFNEVELKFTIADTGIGIHKEAIPDLFSSFKRVDEKNNRNIEGTGLGLSITKQLVDLMGGKIEVDSIYTKGSTFTVTLNQQIINEEPIGVVDFTKKKRILDYEKYKQRFEAPDARILIVDDNDMNLLVATKLLRSTKIQIDTAKSGRECLMLTKEKLYHVIFMDHKMPDMDGVETLQRLKNQENGKCINTPVIALTANVMSGAEQIYRDYGFVGYLAKPINGALFEATLLKYLPEEFVEFDKELEEGQEAEIQVIKESNKKSIHITTDCVCDIPRKYVEELDIGLMPYYVVTNEGQFRDIDEIQSAGLLDYLKTEENQAHSHEASEEEYENFFADALGKGEQVIHITIAEHIRTEEHSAAKAAMRGFDHVTIYESGHLSSGMGIMVLAAAKMAKEHKSVEEILQKLDSLKKRISTSFIVPNMTALNRNGLVGNKIAKICNALSLHTVLHMKHSALKCRWVEVGDLKDSYYSYIRHTLKNRKTIDTRIVFITYVGCTIKQLQDFSNEIAKYVKFEKVIYQQASATISSNCGIGTMGILFVRKSS